MTDDEIKALAKQASTDEIAKLGYTLDGYKLPEDETKSAKATYTDEWHWYCGKCGCRIPLKIKAHYCHKCGTLIDWTDRKELRNEKIFADCASSSL